MKTKYQIIVGLILGIAIIFSMAIITGTIEKLEENKKELEEINKVKNGDTNVTIVKSDNNNTSNNKKFDMESKVVKVVDGDTIYLENNVKIRLSITDTPEKKQVNFEEAKQFTTQLCLDKIASIDIDNKQPLDRYKRTVAVVYCDGKNLNQELINNGLARIYFDYCGKTEFIYLCALRTSINNDLPKMQLCSLSHILMPFYNEPNKTDNIIYPKYKCYTFLI